MRCPTCDGFGTDVRVRWWQFWKSRICGACRGWGTVDPPRYLAMTPVRSIPIGFSVPAGSEVGGRIYFDRQTGAPVRSELIVKKPDGKIETHSGPSQKRGDWDWLEPLSEEERRRNAAMDFGTPPEPIHTAHSNFDGGHGGHSGGAGASGGWDSGSSHHESGSSHDSGVSSDCGGGDSGGSGSD